MPTGNMPGKELLDYARRLTDEGRQPAEIIEKMLAAFSEEPPSDRIECDVLDLVNHPPHYTAHPSGVECIEITEHMGFNVGNAVKYLWRADEKGSALEDLKKARWYVDREIRRREPVPDTEDEILTWAGSSVHP